MDTEIPKQCTVLIIGGGPAGSSAATHLVKHGVEVVLFEKEVFPRNQVGESLIPHIWKYTDQLGVSEKIEQQNFIKKSGGITVWNNKIHQILFAKYGYARSGLHVERDVFDQVLLTHAQEQNALVFHKVVVKKVDFSKDNPVITYIDKRDSINYEGKINCRYVIDASGHSSLLAHQFDVRETVVSELKFLSLWGYFNNSRYVGIDRQSHTISELSIVAPVTFVMSYKDGWLWHIVLREKTSVGLVIHTDKLKGLDKVQRAAFFKQSCLKLPYLRELLRDAQFIEDSLQFRPDYSYYIRKTCDKKYYCIGDAAGFVDPIFSHGVQNAFYNAAIASLAVMQALKTPEKSTRIASLCENRMQQFYSFSRSLSLGDYGSNGVNPELVKSLIKSMPILELELILVASEMTNRSENFKKIAHQAGVWERLSEQYYNNKNGCISDLNL